MKKLVTLLLVVLGLSIQMTTINAQVAVVDLDAVARELGVLKHIEVTMSNLKFDEEEKLKDTQQKLAAQMKAAMEKAGKDPDKEKQQQIAITNRELQVQFQQAQVEATKRFQQKRLEMINEFRQEVKPLALKVAKEKDLNVILIKTMPPVYAFDKSIDITGDLVEEAKKAKMTRTAPALKNK